MCGISLFDQPRRGPVVPIETSFEIATTDKEQPCVDPYAVQSTTIELRHGTRAGPLVGEDDHAHPHRQSIADRSRLNSSVDLGKVFLWE